MVRRAVHPGEILADELAYLGITPTELSRYSRFSARYVKIALSNRAAPILGRRVRVTVPDGQK